MKTYGGAEVYIHHSWFRHQMEVSGQLDASAALLPASGPRSLSGRYGEDKILPLREIEPRPSSP
jgi:hypothetical protein